MTGTSTRLAFMTSSSVRGRAHRNMTPCAVSSRLAEGRRLLWCPPAVLPPVGCAEHRCSATRDARPGVPTCHVICRNSTFARSAATWAAGSCHWEPLAHHDVPGRLPVGDGAHWRRSTVAALSRFRVPCDPTLVRGARRCWAQF
jgi:hypothetical protein